MNDVIRLINIGNSLATYVTPVLLSVGLLGNIFSFVIYKRKVFRDRTIGSYLSILAILDSINLIQFFYQTKVQYYKSDVFLCGLVNFFVWWTPSICAWITMITSLDRFIATKSPLSIQLLNKKWLQYSSIVIIIIIQTFFYSFYFLFSLILPTNSLTGYNCFFYTPLFVDVLIYLQVVNQIVIPLGVMLLSTVFIAKYLLKKTKIKKTGQINSSKEKQFAIMTLCINVFFFVCYLPINLYSILSKTLGVFNKLTIDIYYEYWKLTGIITSIILYLHSTLPFFIYFITNRIFRQEVILILSPITSKLYPKSKNVDRGISQRRLQSRIGAPSKVQTQNTFLSK